MGLTVSQVARIANVSVRALHHYDEIGLLVPSARSDAGYRLYDDEDLARLQQILFFRALEVPLPEIARIMRDPDFDVAATLRFQREQLVEKLAHAQGLIAAVDRAIEKLEKGGGKMKDEPQAEEMFSAWKDFKQEDYEAEAEQRWGNTDAWKESKRRTARYTKQDWEVIKKEGEANLRALAEAFDAGAPPDAPAAMAAAEAHRLHIDRWFYPCSHAMQRKLGELFVNDPRFTATYDRVRPGLAAFAKAAIDANADAATGKP